MSLTTSQRTRLGIFLMMGVAMLALFTVIPIALRLSQKQATYFSYFKGESLSGLEEGAHVKFRGIPIGKINHISYDPSNLSRIKVAFRIRADFPVKMDMFVQTGMIGITGLKYVEMLGGSNEAPSLAPDSEIPAKASLMSTISGKSEVLIAKVEMLINHLNTVTNPESLASARQILNNVAVITADTRTIMSTMAPDIALFTRSAVSGMAQIDSVAREVRHFTAGLEDIADKDQINSVVTAVDSTVQAFRKLATEMERTVRQSREDFSVSMANIKVATEHAERLAKMLAEDPSLLLRTTNRKERKVR